MRWLTGWLNQRRGLDMWTRKFWLATAERALKTFAQTFVLLLGAGAVDLLSVPWRVDLSLSIGAALLSVLTSIASSQVADATSPSLVEGKS